MWLYNAGGHAAVNLAHATRLYVEETGTGAALKADIAGKTVLVHYFGSKAEAQAALAAIMERQEAGASLARL